MNCPQGYVNVEIYLSDLLPDYEVDKKVILKFNPARTDYDALQQELVQQLQDSEDCEISEIADRVTCRFHYHRIAQQIVSKLKTETYCAD